MRECRQLTVCVVVHRTNTSTQRLCTVQGSRNDGAAAMVWGGGIVPVLGSNEMAANVPSANCNTGQRKHTSSSTGCSYMLLLTHTPYGCSLDCLLVVVLFMLQVAPKLFAQLK